MTITNYDPRGAELTPNESLAHQLINRAIDRAGTDGVISGDIARLTAATVHAGSTTALGRFAATGVIVDRRKALAEITSLRHAPATWRAALQRYLQQEDSHGKA